MPGVTIGRIDGDSSLEITPYALHLSQISHWAMARQRKIERDNELNVSF